MFASLTAQAIRALRGPRRADLDPNRPHGFFVEEELAANGRVESVATLLLTNRECPFTCLFCDLWKNTLVDRTPAGAIPRQIDFALARLPPARHIKLYSSGNFFDPQAIPLADHEAIAARLSPFDTVIVENHPRLVTSACRAFRERLPGEFEVAMGLETIHPEVLPRLNKQMTLDDFRYASEQILEWGGQVRAFVLLKPPFLDEDEGMEWAVRSVEWVFRQGVRVCSLIPTRGGNGALDALGREGRFSPPRLASLERAFSEALALRKGRVFVDLWEANRFATCDACAPARLARLALMNHAQVALDGVPCACGGSAA